VSVTIPWTAPCVAHCAYRLATGHEASHSFNWTVRHFLCLAMISTANPPIGPAVRTVARGECFSVPITLNARIMCWRCLMTTGQDKRCRYLWFLPAKVKAAVPTGA
jgi:hypothetical protein